MAELVDATDLINKNIKFEKGCTCTSTCIEDAHLYTPTTSFTSTRFTTFTP